MESILKTEVWKYLPIRTIAQLSKCSKTVRCDPQLLWRHVLNRDFNESEGGKDTYLRYYNIIKYFTVSIPTITELAIKVIDKFIPIDEWSLILNECNQCIATKVINVNLLLYILNHIFEDTVEKADQDEEYYKKREQSGDAERQDYLNNLIWDIQDDLFAHYSVTSCIQEHGSFETWDARNLEPHLKPVYVKTNMYTKSSKMTVNMDQDFMFILVEFCIPQKWCLSTQDFEGKGRLVILSESDI